MEASADGEQKWEVVGGVDKGGILVRNGLELTSPQAAARLSVGAILRELERPVGERLHFARLTGTGPDEGWISISLKDKVLACRVAPSFAPLEASEADGGEELAAADSEDESGFPAMSPLGVEELSEAEQERQSQLKQQAADSQDSGNDSQALEKLTEAISIGCATALMYSRRAELLLRLGRPKAAVADCGAALGINPDSGKAFKIRAQARMKLKHWQAAHADFQEGLKIDYDEGTYAVSLSVAAKMKEIQVVATSRRVKLEDAESQKKLREAKAEQEVRLRQQQAKEAADTQRIQEEAAKSKLLANLKSDPRSAGLLQQAKRAGHMTDFMGVKRGACKCKKCEFYLWRPVRMNS